MSLSLDLGTEPSDTVATMRTAEYVDVGRLKISTADFCQLAMYVLTNTDLVANDPRLHFLVHLAKLNIVDGWLCGGKRLG